MTDIKLLEPQRLTDNPDGGGLATATEVVDGQINNVFPDISRIDRVNGEVSLRKVFVQATGADTEVFSGVHAIVQQPPGDERVSAVMFEVRATNGGMFWGSERADAQALVERYLDASVITRMIPYDRQLAGQRAVIVFQRPELALPDVGEVYVLTNETVNPVTVEFFRVQAVESEVQTFTDGGDFEARVITMTITEPLSQEFAGSQPNRAFAAAAGRSIIRSARVSDAARYKGITPLAQDVDAGAVQLKVESVYTQLAPAATAEAAVTDAAVAGARSILSAAEDATELALTMSLAVGQTLTRYVGRGIAPGSASGGWNNASFVDNGDGTTTMSGSSVGSAVVTIDYEAGAITRTGTGLSSASLFNVAFTPAAPISKAANTAEQRITLSTRGYVYTQSCTPIPEPGTLVVSYRALGKWFELRDDGEGGLVGEQGVGAGSIDYATGSAVVTLGALPDIDSSLIFSWGTAAEYQIRTGDLAIKPPAIRLALEAGNAEPGTVSIAWEAGGVAKTATDDGAGNLTGDATGRVVYANGDIEIRPTLLPDPTTDFVIDYEAEDVETEISNPSKAGSTITLTAAAAPIRPRSILITYQQQTNVSGLAITTTQQLTDNGAGELVDAAGNIKAGSAVNYATGEITFNPDFTVVTPVLNYERFESQLPARTADPSVGYFASIARFGTWPAGAGTQSTPISYANGSAVTLQYKQDSASDGVHQDTVSQPSLQIDLLPTVDLDIVPGSVLLNFGGREWIDRQGVMYYAHNRETNAATAGGSINYATGVVTLTSWDGGAASTLTVESLLGQAAQVPQVYVHGRTPGSPLRPASFFVRALRYDTGAQISATADVNGNLSSANVHGYVDITTGVFAVMFGSYVLDSALSPEDKAEPWYDVANVDGDGYVFKPVPIIPGSLRFNCVIQTTLPLDPRIIGINPVRLPLDGRVQMIRPGDTLVIHDTVVDTLTNPLAANDVEALSRTNVASVVLYDQLDVRVDPALYTVDLVAGTITFADPLDLSAYTQPLVARQTVEDMALCTDAQITGDIAIAQPLSRGYTAANSYVSSALVVGDAQARYQGLFALNTWVGDWDATTGAPPASGAQYNDLTYPLVVTNRDAITERWRLQFTSSTAFNVVGEQLGIVATGTTAGDVAPVNPATGQPYFVMDADGFGTGWATGNTIRFDTVAAGAPLWLARTTRPGPVSVTDDLTRLQLRWDKDEV